MNLMLGLEHRNIIYAEAFIAAQNKYWEANDYTYPEPKGVYYLAGPMSNLPSFNFPAFDAAAGALRKHQYLIVSPAELDVPEEREEALNSETGVHGDGAKVQPRAYYLKRDFLIVLEVDGVIVLPDWWKSSGARDETRIAMALDKPVLRYPDLQPIDVHPYISASMDVDRFARLFSDKLVA